MSELNRRWASTLVRALVDGGVRHAVVAPGSRSTPLALAFADAEGVRVASVHDERSAAFMALGLSRATGTPVAVLCTSGTAGAHFLPAAMEAHAAGGALVLLTADRPWRLQGFGAPQTTQQVGLFGRFVVEEAALADPVGGDAALMHLAAAAGRLVAAAVRERAPVHLNVPFDEPLDEGGERRDVLVGPRAPQVLAPRAEPDTSSVVAALAGARRGVIVVGPRAHHDGLGDAVHRLGRRLGFPVLAEAASNARYGFSDVVAMYDALLRAPAFAESMRPDVVLRFGGGLTSKTLQGWLDASGARCFVFADAGRLVDPSHRAEAFVLGDAVRACEALASASSATPETWGAEWRAAEARLRGALARLLGEGGAAPLSEPLTASAVVASLRPGAALVVSNSMPIRDVDAFAPAGAPLRVFANRGVNGIDGVTSTALGVAAAGLPTVLLTGDVALLHDASAWVAAKRLGLSLAVVVVNNDGGGIFHFLPVAGCTRHFETLFGTPHGVDLSALASLGGARLHRPQGLGALREALGAAMEGGLHLIEVRTRRDDNVATHAALFEALAREATS